MGYLFGRELQCINLPYNAEALARGFKAYENGLHQNDPPKDEKMDKLILLIQEELYEKKLRKIKSALRSSLEISIKNWLWSC
jgi:hypothetical protein